MISHNLSQIVKKWTIKTMSNYNKYSYITTVKKSLKWFCRSHKGSNKGFTFRKKKHVESDRQPAIPPEPQLPQQQHRATTANCVLTILS